MKVKDLIKALKVLDPEALVGLQIGRNQEYRDMCAKAELIGGDILGFLVVDMVEIHDDADEDDALWLNIVLRQDNIGYLPERAEEFDKTYIKKRCRK